MHLSGVPGRGQEGLERKKMSMGGPSNCIFEGSLGGVKKSEFAGGLRGGLGEGGVAVVTLRVSVPSANKEIWTKSALYLNNVGAKRTTIGVPPSMHPNVR